MITLVAKVNNKDVFPVRITTGSPVISWSFDEIDILIPDSTGDIERTTIIEQVSYEVRIASSATDWGTDDFTGNMLSTGWVLEPNRQIIYDGAEILRGQTLWGQIRINDALDESGWVTFSLLFNRVPVVTAPSISPAIPSVTDTLVVTYSFSDADGDLESGTQIRWFRNGTHERGFDDQTSIPSEALAFKDIWMVDVLPSDGLELGERATSSAVTVATVAPIASAVAVLPENPNENDILKADYVLESDIDEDQSEIRWFVNGVLQSDFNDQVFVRMNHVIGDVVRFEITPSDGVTSGTKVSSGQVSIVPSDFLVYDIRVDGQTDPLNVLSTRPVITWKSHNPDNGDQRFVSIKIGTFFGADNILDEMINTDKTVFNTPANVLKKGRDYFVSIAVSDTESFNQYTSSHFRITGSRWTETVSNSTGWTIEVSLVVDQAVSFDASQYQVIRFQDGIRFGEVRVFRDRLAFASQDVVFSSVLGMNKPVTITIVGVGDSAKVYLDRVLAIDATNLMIQESDSKRLEIGTTNPDVIGVRYKSFFYSTTDNYDPSDVEDYGSFTSYANTQFHKYVQFPDEKAETIEGFLVNSEDFKVVGVNPRNTAIGGAVYTIASRNTKRFPTVNRTFTPINRISVSPNGRYLVLSHARGASIFKSYPIVAYDHTLDLESDNRVTPDKAGWELFQNVGFGVATFDNDGLVINTTFASVGRRDLTILDE